MKKPMKPCPRCESTNYETDEIPFGGNTQCRDCGFIGMTKVWNYYTRADNSEDELPNLMEQSPPFAPSKIILTMLVWGFITWLLVYFTG